ncbi:MAG: efflux RND transporter periplasmic adaptor subunit [Caldilineaceae bacterium]
MTRIFIRIGVGLVLLVLAAGGATYYAMQTAGQSRELTLSGSIEATEIRLSSEFGGKVRKVYVDEGDQVMVGQHLIDIYSAANGVNEVVMSPINGVVLERLIEPNEHATAGGTVLVVAALDSLTLKIYAPENLYGQITLGQTLPVTVDSFPGETFQGVVRSIANQAAFTPRNVQTTDSRQTTVYAVKLDLVQTSNKLKPGMPADVHLQLGP